MLITVHKLMIHISKRRNFLKPMIALNEEYF